MFRYVVTCLLYFQSRHAPRRSHPPRPRASQRSFGSPSPLACKYQMVPSIYNSSRQNHCSGVGASAESQEQTAKSQDQMWLTKQASLWHPHPYAALHSRTASNLPCLALRICATYCFNPYPVHMCSGVVVSVLLLVTVQFMLVDMRLNCVTLRHLCYLSKMRVGLPTPDQSSC